MECFEILKNKVLNKEYLNRDEALLLNKFPLKKLCDMANDIRRRFCGEKFDICTIINGKSGKCSENCKFCAQSSYYKTKINEHKLLSSDLILKEGKLNFSKGIRRFSIVTSGRKLSYEDIESICRSVKLLKNETNLNVCGSFGLLNKEEFRKLKEAGIDRIHNNLETSKNNFPNICTTHKYEDKIRAIKNAKSVGLSVCSGGIIGLGEKIEDIIDMLIELRDLEIRSIPINILNPIKGTPYQDNKIITNDEMCRIVAIARFLVPDAYIRLAGGRGVLEDKGRKCFMSGANATISGDMLTTIGTSIEDDLNMIKEMGFEV